MILCRESTIYRYFNNPNMSFSLTNFTHRSPPHTERVTIQLSRPPLSVGDTFLIPVHHMWTVLVPQLVKVKLNLEGDDRESFSSSAAMRWVEAQGEPHQLVSSEGGALLLAILYSCACTDSALDCRGLCATLWESPPLRVAPLSVPPPRGSFPSAHRRG